MPDFDYELIVIGGGPAGEKAAAQAAYFDHKTCLIERYKRAGRRLHQLGHARQQDAPRIGPVPLRLPHAAARRGLKVEFEADVTLQSFMPAKTSCSAARRNAQAGTSAPLAQHRPHDRRRPDGR